MTQSERCQLWSWILSLDQMTHFQFLFVKVTRWSMVWMNTWIHQKYMKKKWRTAFHPVSIWLCLHHFNVIWYVSVLLEFVGVVQIFAFFMCFSGQTWHGFSNFTSHDMLRGFVLTWTVVDCRCPLEMDMNISRLLQRRNSTKPPGWDCREMQKCNVNVGLCETAEFKMMRSNPFEIRNE